MGRQLSDHEMASLRRAFGAACDEATLTGTTGREVVLRIVLERHTSEASEEDFKRLVRTIIAERRGLSLACANEKR